EGLVLPIDRDVRNVLHQDEPRAAEAGLAAKAVDREVVRDRHQPRGEAAARRVEAGGLPPGHHEDVLRELLRGLRAAEDPHAHGEDRTREPRVDRPDRVLVASAELLHQLLLLPGDQRSLRLSGHSASFRYTRAPRAGALSMLDLHYPRREG